MSAVCASVGIATYYIQQYSPQGNRNCYRICKIFVRIFHDTSDVHTEQRQCSALLVSIRLKYRHTESCTARQEASIDGYVCRIVLYCNVQTRPLDWHPQQHAAKCRSVAVLWVLAFLLSAHRDLNRGQKVFLVSLGGCLSPTCWRLHGETRDLYQRVQCGSSSAVAQKASRTSWRRARDMRSSIAMFAMLS